MEIGVLEAAGRLGVSASRVRQLLDAGDLRGRRVSGVWMVDANDVARRAVSTPRTGRPLAPRRAWAILDLLNVGNAPWLSYAERSQVRAYLARLEAPTRQTWADLLRRRSDVVRAAAHPAARTRLARADGVLRAGVAEAAARGFDVIDLGSDGEFYLQPGAWPALSRSLAISERLDHNIVVRMPLGVWPFAHIDQVPPSVLAADLLESLEPRGTAVGTQRLNELLAAWREANGFAP